MRTKLQEEPSGGMRARSASAHVRARGVPDRASSARALKARELLSPGATPICIEQRSRVVEERTTFGFFHGT